MVLSASVLVISIGIAKLAMRQHYLVMNMSHASALAFFGKSAGLLLAKKAQLNC